MDEALLIAIVTSIAALVGVALGSILTYRFTLRTQDKQAKAQKQDMLQNTRREAIERAMAWLPQIRNALMAAEVSVYRNQSFKTSDGGRIDLVARLAQLDTPEHLRDLLPDGTYEKARTIALGLQEISFAGTFSKFTEEERVGEYQRLRRLADDLDSSLRAAYLQTFE